MGGGLFLGSAPSATATSFVVGRGHVERRGLGPSAVPNDPKLQSLFFGMGQVTNAGGLSWVGTSRAAIEGLYGRPVPIGEFQALGTGGFTGRVDPLNVTPLLVNALGADRMRLIG